MSVTALDANSRMATTQVHKSLANLMKTSRTESEGRFRTI